MSDKTNSGIIDTVTSKISETANYVSEKFNENSAAASKEANKQVAKDSNASLGDRASAALNAGKDKMDESSSAAKAEAHKETAKN